MKIKLALTSLLLSFNMANAESDYLSFKINQLSNDIKSIDSISRNIKFQEFRINLRERKINNMNYPNLYFLINDDHNGKPLYWLRYYFKQEDVQPYLEKLQRTLQGRAVK